MADFVPSDHYCLYIYFFNLSQLVSKAVPDKISPSNSFVNLNSFEFNHSEPNPGEFAEKSVYKNRSSRDLIICEIHWQPTSYLFREIGAQIFGYAISTSY